MEAYLGHYMELISYIRCISHACRALKQIQKLPFVFQQLYLRCKCFLTNYTSTHSWKMTTYLVNWSD